MEVIVLGASGTYPTVDDAASGFLVIADDTKVWLDAGPGTFQNLQRHIDFHDLDAVVLSHMHLDHVLDFYAFHYALAYGMASVGPKALPVFAPAGSEPYLLSLRPDGFGGYFDFKIIHNGEHLRLGPMDWTFALTRHPQTCLASRVEHGSKSVTYTADTAPCQEVTELATACGVLIAEASLQDPTETLKDVHMTAHEAGEMATASGAAKLVLTHISPGLDPQLSVKLAAQRFDGDVVAARDNMRITL